MYSYKYTLFVYNNKWFSTHVLSVSLSSLNSLSQFLSSIYFHTQFLDGRTHIRDHLTLDCRQWGSVTLRMYSYNTLKEVQPILTFATIAKNSDWSSQWLSMRKDHGAKLRRVVCKIILQKYTSLWIYPCDVLVFTAYPGMDQIFTDYPTGPKQMACIFCHFQSFSLLPVGRSVNI